MTQLTLPLVNGKKYVCRNGEVITMEEESDGSGWMHDEAGGYSYVVGTGTYHSDGEKSDYDIVADYIEVAKLTLPLQVGRSYVGRDGRVRTITQREREWMIDRSGISFRADTGTYFSCGESHPFDLVADAESKPVVKEVAAEEEGHEHAENMRLFADDALKSKEPWRLWEMKGGSRIWIALTAMPSWVPGIEYRRKGVPDVHASNMMEYAKDAAETDAAWELWQVKGDDLGWVDLERHPEWCPTLQYRRKAV